MNRLQQANRGAATVDLQRTTAIHAPVGASYTFDPDADGLGSIYALRVLERGVDPRTLCAEARASRSVSPEWIHVPTRSAGLAPAAQFGRGTRGHRSLPTAAPISRSGNRTAIVSFGRQPAAGQNRWPRRLAAAGLLLLLLLPLSIIAAHAQTLAPQSRYIVQPGDTLESVAGEFGVDPAAILAASDIQNPPFLAPSEIIIIPAPGEAPDEAAFVARQRVGTSPFVVGAHDVAPGETLAKIAGAYGLDALTLAAFNGVEDVDALGVGTRLRIPLTDSIQGSIPDAEPLGADLAVGGPSTGAIEPRHSPVFAADVPAYQQQYSLSCEYAATYIATSAFGNGIPESAFMERIGRSDNPHWGYRGDIYGPWGGTEDYGIYPEALVPTLNDYGFVGDVFYGGADSLTARLDSGMPVVVWLGYFGDTGWVNQDDSGSYLLVPGMHVVTVYGYDDGGVYLSNPGRGNYDYYAWPDFLAMWQVLDGMALGIAPM